MSTPKSAPTIWSAGRYDAVGERIAPIAAEVVAAARRRGPFHEVADLACGTGNAALAAAAVGAHVTAVDVTPELIAIGRQKAQRIGRAVAWVTADAADTGLPGGSFDTVVSNMGIVFVEPTTQVAEVARLLKPGGALAFSSWVRDANNPFFGPIVEVVGPPPTSGFAPDQWGEPETVRDRLAADFVDVEIARGSHPWRLGTLDEAVRFVTQESPMHVSVFSSVDGSRRDRLIAAFTETFDAHVGRDGIVAYDAPYAVVTALRR
ncbi:class I SAM-dependent methyltransferase [Mycobacterium sp. 1274761.0]|uniref:class I SAM-dependent methyltransferase n=1 Tax=Mycobacterium sp. 1274761.0 TaxID=1834077 RepID=UPI0008012E7C|nr:class I SAM-dependent methyltransferase [Mycobacterium sp. 1274761.0]OBK77683.1 SAM-dependent methyltransferase [Mycobacterium sp. 1274761.0]